MLIPEEFGEPAGRGPDLLLGLGELDHRAMLPRRMRWRRGSRSDESTEYAPAVSIEVSMVGRSASVLAAFDLRHPTMGLSELARRSALPKATVHRLAGQLVEHGFLERDGERYRLGVLLFELGQRVPRSRVLRDAALPFLEDLYVASRETVHLAVPAGRDVMYIDKLVGHSSGRTPSAVAGRLPMHCTATGKAILAHLHPDELEEYLSAPLERVTRHTIVVADVLRTEVAAARRAGWAVEREETLIGYVSVASTVFDGEERPIAALSVTGPGRRLDATRFGPAVRTAARGLTRVLRSEAATA
jgi:DNA-binding IclR family transcriptional regulator